jgi:3D (Asp-Asp-Asp) domain-containing protein
MLTDRRSRSPLGKASFAAIAAIAAAVALVLVGIGTGRRALSSEFGDLGGGSAAVPQSDAAADGVSGPTQLSAARVLLWPERFGRSGVDDHPSARAGATSEGGSDPTVGVFPEEMSIYNGRPVKVVGRMKMVVTAYSPDERSCGASADGITASGYSVLTNGGFMVAADPKVLPLGSLLTVPGYDGEAVVPVLDTGGAIKGNRLDVLFPTHERARQWGVQELEVKVWQYADGLPNDFRRMRRPVRR